MFLQLADDKRAQVSHQNSDALLILVRQNQQLLFEQSQRSEDILDEVRETQWIVRRLGQNQQPVQDSVLWRVELFSLLGQRCALARTPCGYVCDFH